MESNLWQCSDPQLAHKMVCKLMGQNKFSNLINILFFFRPVGVVESMEAIVDPLCSNKMSVRTDKKFSKEFVSKLKGTWIRKRQLSDLGAVTPFRGFQKALAKALDAAPLF